MYAFSSGRISYVALRFFLSRVVVDEVRLVGRRLELYARRHVSLRLVIRSKCQPTLSPTSCHDTMVYPFLVKAGRPRSHGIVYLFHCVEACFVDSHAFQAQALLYAAAYDQ